MRGDAQGASSISPFTSTLRISPGFDPSGIVISSSTVFEVGDIAFSSLIVSQSGRWKFGHLLHNLSPSNALLIVSPLSPLFSLSLSLSLSLAPIFIMVMFFPVFQYLPRSAQHLGHPQQIRPAPNCATQEGSHIFTNHEDCVNMLQQNPCLRGTFTFL